MIGDKYYRLFYVGEGHGVYKETWTCISETEKTALIQLQGGPIKRVLKEGGGKRYAYRDLREAFNAYRVRKERQLVHLQNQLSEVQTAIATLRSEPETILQGLQLRTFWFSDDNDEAFI